MINITSSLFLCTFSGSHLFPRDIVYRQLSSIQELYILRARMLKKLDLNLKLVFECMLVTTSCNASGKDDTRVVGRLARSSTPDANSAQ